jgi:hypothetical protein
MLDYSESGHSGLEMEKCTTEMHGYLTEMSDARMPMSAAMAMMPIPSFNKNIIKIYSFLGNKHP